MTLKHFFRPTPATAITALVITGVSAYLMIRTLMCALNGTENCFALPVAAQLALFVVLWPSIIVVRFGGGGVENLQILGLIGVIASLLWTYAALCVLRAVSGLMRKKKKGEEGI